VNTLSSDAEVNFSFPQNWTARSSEPVAPNVPTFGAITAWAPNRFPHQ
jgi:hypothetical protein